MKYCWRFITLLLIWGQLCYGEMGGAENTPKAKWQSPHALAIESQSPVALIPFPRNVEWHTGALNITHKSPKLSGDTAGMVQTALEDFYATESKYKDTFPVVCRLVEKNTLATPTADEAYHLSISDAGVTLSAESEAGLFNGFQTLRQMILNGGGKLPHCQITDWPAFPLRGFMHDCGRNFREISRLKKEISLASQLKVNAFHWHLCDHPGWRVECLCHPRLNSPEFRTRDHKKTYSYAEIRDLISYAAKRNVRIIPELDMPGHSDYFTRAFGFTMHSEKGMQVIGELLDEFCHQIPKELCPIIHFGADETSIPNAKEFVEFVTNKLRAHERIPMQWSSKRDLPISPHSIEQVWAEGAHMASKSHQVTANNRKIIDSSIGYTNLLDPALLVRRYFFMQPCGVDAGNAQHLGVLLCTWPDGRVDDKNLIPGMNALWPSMMAMAERAWVGGSQHGDSFPITMPPPDSEAARAYAMFERRMQKIRKTQFASEAFPVWMESGISWQITPPIPSTNAGLVRRQILSTGSHPSFRHAYGGSLYLRTRSNTGNLGMFSTTPIGHTIWAQTSIYAPSAGTYSFHIGFDAPARSNRRYSGLPKNGQWSPSNTRIWLNGKEIHNPRTFQHAGQFNQPNNQWNFETPLHPEEIWWMLPPIKLELQQGKNTFLIEHPYTTPQQSWGLSLIPVS